ncbi:MAG TPA: hypothetical protein VH479_06170 [Acidimicrobiales bacterium]|jgi:hypothetical protein
MQRPQRTVVVVATGLALAVLAATINRELTDAAGGWFAYAPNTGMAFGPADDSTIWRESAVWLGAIAIGTGIAQWLYRRRPEAGPGT